MDTQKEAAWCQLYSFQGMLNKNFKLKPTVHELYDIAFPGDDHYEETKYMESDEERRGFIDRIIEKMQNSNLKRKRPTRYRQKSSLR